MDKTSLELNVDSSRAPQDILRTLIGNGQEAQVFPGLPRSKSKFHPDLRAMASLWISYLKKRWTISFTVCLNL